MRHKLFFVQDKIQVAFIVICWEGLFFIAIIVVKLIGFGERGKWRRSGMVNSLNRILFEGPI